MDDLVHVGESVLEVGVEDQDHGGLLHVGLAEGRLPQGPFGGGVPHHHDPPGLEVPGRGRPEGGLEDFPEKPLGYGVLPVTPDGTPL